MMKPAMDIARPASVARQRRGRRIAYGVGGALSLFLVMLGISRLKPAAPTVQRSALLLSKVRRGGLLRQVRGLGTLVPEEIRWIPAATEGRVETLVIQPGTAVKPDTVVIELTNPELEQQALEADSQLREAEASFVETKASLERAHLDQESQAARVQSEYHQAKLRAETDQLLARQGLIAELTMKLSKLSADELADRDRIEKERVTKDIDATEAQLAVQRARVEQRRAMARLRRQQVRALQVRAGLAGVLQQLTVEVGQRVTPGTNLARVAKPERLKAVIRIAETEARDVQLAQLSSIDTRNGIVEGRVSRIDPASQNGTVTVDVALSGLLPKGARPDMTVDGTIELERLTDVLYVSRPTQGHPDSVVGLFKVEPDGTAARTRVRLGRASVTAIEVVEGLKVGDEVVLSDTSEWDGFDRIRIN
jgi:HlyD family secretion protein